MDVNLHAALIGALSGAAGYLVSTFWVRPIMRYHELRQAVLSDLIFFANVVNAEGLNEEMQNRYRKRVESNRRHSSDLAACILVLPLWYKHWLRLKRQDPNRAAEHLMGFSNTTDYETGAKMVSHIKRCLGIHTEIF